MRMDFIFNVAVPIGCVVGAVLLAVFVIGPGGSRRLVRVGALTLVALTAVEFLLEYRPGSGFVESATTALAALYLAVQAFIGNGNFDGLSQSPSLGLLLLTSAKLLLAMIALATSVSAVISLLSQRVRQAFFMRFSSFDELILIYGGGPLPVRLANALADGGGRRLVVRVDDTAIDGQPEGDSQPTVVVCSTDSKLARLWRKAKSTHVFLFGSITGVNLDHWGLQATIHVMTDDEALVSQLAQIQTAAAVQVDSLPTITARCLVRSLPPFDAQTQQMAERFLLVGAVDESLRAVFRQLVMNSPQPDNTPSFTFVGNGVTSYQGTFDFEYPGLSTSCTVRFADCGPDSREFYAMLSEITFDYVAINAVTEDEGSRIRSNIARFCRTHGQKQPRFLLLRPPNDSELKTLVSQSLDTLARRVNGFYEGLSSDTAVETEWRNLSFTDRDSSRASADFLAVHAAYRRAGMDPETLARLEHRRWVAYHAVHGYCAMTAETSRARYQEALAVNPEDLETAAKAARIDTVQHTHICFVDWDALDAVSQAYNDLTGQTKDFKDSDRDIIRLVSALGDENPPD
jgi:hypothetical protein